MAHTRLDKAELAIRFSAVYAAIFLQYGFLLPFWPVYLAARGLDPQAIGLFYAVMGAARVVTVPLVALAGERYGQGPRYLMLLALLSAVPYGVFAMTDSFPVYLVLAAAIATFLPSLMAILDAKTLAVAQSEGISYGRARLWGSVTFIAMNLAGGALIGALGADHINWMMFVSCIVGAASLLLLPATGQPTAAAHFSFAQARGLLTHWRLITFIVAAGLGQASHAVLYTFGTLDWQRLGYSDTVIGSLWAIGVVAEIVLFAFGQQLGARLGPMALAMVAVTLACVRWLAMSFEPPLGMVFALQILHAFSFAALHLATMSGLHRLVAPHLSATTQGLHVAISGGILMAMASGISGTLYDAFGRGAYYFAALLAASSLATFFVLRRTTGEAV